MEHDTQNKISLVGKTLEEFKTIVSELGMPSFTAKQLSEWVYKKHAFSIDEMSNISVKNRALLNESYEIGRTAPVHTAESEDGTKKYLFKTDTEHFIEAVYIPDEDRATLCVSSQVGCKMGCLFCMTGKQGFIAQLSATEIMNQIMSIPEAEKLTNLVFMGMGEPFDNTLLARYSHIRLWLWMESTTHHRFFYWINSRNESVFRKIKLPFGY